jgi:peptidoglycan hydrolase-like protein with peptidoglycan-binding domain
MLKEYGYYSATIDGKFGDKTEASVKAFQRAEGLDVDGIVGQQTWNRLVALS